MTLRCARDPTKKNLHCTLDLFMRTLRLTPTLCFTAASPLVTNLLDDRFSPVEVIISVTYLHLAFAFVIFNIFLIRKFYSFFSRDSSRLNNSGNSSVTVSVYRTQRLFLIQQVIYSNFYFLFFPYSFHLLTPYHVIIRSTNHHRQHTQR